MKEEKKRSQEQTKAELNLSLRLKMKRKAREKQEELAMDMKLLEEMLQQSQDETSEHNQRKVSRYYYHYLGHSWFDLPSLSVCSNFFIFFFITLARTS